MRRRLSLFVAVLLVLAPAAVAPLARAATHAPALHLQLERSSPAADASLESAPAEIRLWFSERPELAVSMIRVEGPAGAVKTGELAAGDDNDLSVTLPADLTAGAYTVTWRTSSGDGHPIRGNFGFTVAGR